MKEKQFRRFHTKQTLKKTSNWQQLLQREKRKNRNGISKITHQTRLGMSRHIRSSLNLGPIINDPKEPLLLIKANG